MPILTLGISFRRAPIELLERLAFVEDDLTKAYRRAADLDALEETVILSTCNRVEVYASTPSFHAGFLALKRLLSESGGVAADELADPLYSHWERDAAEHLFAVAAGFDSMVLGETQIHAQVREALRRAEAEGAAGPSLTLFFHAATRAGRRARRPRRAPRGPAPRRPRDLRDRGGRRRRARGRRGRCVLGAGRPATGAGRPGGSSRRRAIDRVDRSGPIDRRLGVARASRRRG